MPYLKDLSPETQLRTLQIVEALARQLGLLPPLPEPVMPTTTTSIGTTGRDYSTIASWEADLDNGGVYTSGDDALGECYDDAAFDETFTINGGGTVGLNGVTLSVASGERHDGTAGTGARIVRTGSGTAATLTPPSGMAAYDINWLEVDVNGQSAAQAVLKNFSNSIISSLRRMILHDSVAPTSSILGEGRDVRWLDCIAYGATASTVGNVAGFGFASATGTTIAILNCTSHGHDNNSTGNAYCYMFPDSANKTVQNSVGTDAGGTTTGTIQDFQQASPSTATVDHNAASDTSASGTGSLDEVTTADQYVSTTGGSEDFHLKTGADCIDAGTDLGTTPSGVELDIDGRDRDASGDTWDIGADEFVAAGGAATPHNWTGLALDGPLKRVVLQ